MVLPIALPGIVTGIALQNTFCRRIDLGLFDFSVGLGFHSLVIAHATFCIVVAVQQRARPVPATVAEPEEASADLGAHATQTFRYVTFPLLRSALLAGGILAFGLSFDEIVVTTFTAGAGSRDVAACGSSRTSAGRAAAHRHGVATAVMLLSIIRRLGGPASDQRRRTGDGAVPAEHAPVA